MLELESFAISDAGRVRDHNEDFFGSFVPASENEGRTLGWLYAVADGVGGEDQGEVASQIAVETLIGAFREATRGEPHTVTLQRAFQKANIEIYETARAAGGIRMATTLVACAFRYDRVVVAHVGDSRCYLIRRGAATQLTRDHTLVADQVRLGVLSAAQAESAPTRHILSRSLGCDLLANVEIGDHQIQAGDVIALCSDGIHGPVKAAEAAEILRWNPHLETAARKLVHLAGDRDGGDNATLQLIRVKSVERVGMYRGRPYKLR